MILIVVHYPNFILNINNNVNNNCANGGWPEILGTNPEIE